MAVEAAKDAATKVGSAGMSVLRSAWGVATSKWTWGIIAAITVACATADPVNTSTVFKSVAQAKDVSSMAIEGGKAVPSIIGGGGSEAIEGLANTLKFGSAKVAGGSEMLSNWLNKGPA